MMLQPSIMELANYSTDDCNSLIYVHVNLETVAIHTRVSEVLREKCRKKLN